MTPTNTEALAAEPRIERLRELFYVDEEEGVLRWIAATNNRVKAGSRAGCYDDKGYLIVRVDGRICKAHRIVFAMTNGYYPKQVDHINGIKSDNRPSNLRAADAATNTHNSRRPRNNTSGVKGVSLDKRTGRWQARLVVKGKLHVLGSFSSLQEAAEVTRNARHRLHKEFARHE